MKYQTEGYSIEIVRDREVHCYLVTVRAGERHAGAVLYRTYATDHRDGREAAAEFVYRHEAGRTGYAVAVAVA